MYADHYNGWRPHRTLRLRPPRPTSPVPEPVDGRIRSRPILGGLLNEYEAAARSRWSGAMAEFWHPTGGIAAGSDRRVPPEGGAPSSAAASSTSRWAPPATAAGRAASLSQRPGVPALPEDPLMGHVVRVRCAPAALLEGPVAPCRAATEPSFRAANRHKKVSQRVASLPVRRRCPALDPPC